MFHDNMKHALTKLFSYDDIDIAQSHIFVLCNNVSKCIICAQVITPIINLKLSSPFLICDECCYECIGDRNFIEFTKFDLTCKICPHRFVCNYRMYNHYRYYVSSHFVNSLMNNSHKLMHRFYHTVPIIFLISRTDHNSYCCGLIMDVMIHILKFIY